MVWIKNSGREDIVRKDSNYCYDNYRLCSDHFESQMFSNVQRSKLLPIAVPTVFNISDNSSKVRSETGMYYVLRRSHNCHLLRDNCENKCNNFNVYFRKTDECFSARSAS